MRVLALVDLDGFHVNPVSLRAALGAARLRWPDENEGNIDVVAVLAGNTTTMARGRRTWGDIAKMVGEALGTWNAQPRVDITTELVFSWVGPESSDRALWIAMSKASCATTAGDFTGVFTITRDRGLHEELRKRCRQQSPDCTVLGHTVDGVFSQLLLGAFRREAPAALVPWVAITRRAPVQVLGEDAPLGATLVAAPSDFREILDGVHQFPWLMSQITATQYGSVSDFRNVSRVSFAGPVAGFTPAHGTEVVPSDASAPVQPRALRWRMAASRQGAVICESDDGRWVFESRWPAALLEAALAVPSWIAARSGTRSQPVPLIARSLNHDTLFAFETGEHWWLEVVGRHPRGSSKWRVPHVGLPGGVVAHLTVRLEVLSPNAVVAVAVDQRGADACGTVRHRQLTRGGLQLVTLVDGSQAVLLATWSGSAGTLAVQPIQAFGITELTEWLAIGEGAARDLLAAPLIVPVPHPA